MRLKALISYKSNRLTARKSWINKKYKRGYWTRINRCGVNHLESELTKELSRHIQEHIDRQIIEEIKRLKVNDQTKTIQKI